MATNLEARSRSRSWTLPLIAAIAVVLARLPFLLQGDAFFNADEAIEGLMARHLGELPVFMWGQGYKGVPEVYLDAVVFAVFGSGVIQLKSVTLALAAGAVAATVRLADRWYGKGVAAVTAVLLVVAPPSMVSWHLSGNAEVAVLSGLVALMLLEYQSSLDAGTPVRPRLFFWWGAAL